MTAARKQTPTIGLRHPFSNRCRNWLCHRSPKLSIRWQFFFGAQTVVSRSTYIYIQRQIISGRISLLITAHNDHIPTQINPKSFEMRRSFVCLFVCLFVCSSFTRSERARCSAYVRISTLCCFHYSLSTQTFRFHYSLSTQTFRKVCQRYWQRETNRVDFVDRCRATEIKSVRLTA